MKLKHRNDLPKKAEFAQMKRGKFYGIFAEPAAGKTRMIKTELVEYCKENKLRLLILTHRDSLKLQTIADLEVELRELEEKFQGDGIVIVNYQAIEYALKEKKFDRIQPFFTADFIVCDEAHYIVKDHWNEQTDYTVEFLEQAKGVKILMTGTPKEINVLCKLWNVERLINPNRSNNNLKKILIFDKLTDAIDHINKNSNDQNKSLTFVSGKSENVQKYAEENNGSFLCSKHNDLYEESDKNLMDLIIRGDNRAEKGILPTNKIFSTSVLNEGVNFIDPALTTVYSFQPRSSTEFIQQFARPRRSDIIGCIVAPTSNMIAKQIEKAENQLAEIYAKKIESGNEKLGRMSEVYCHEHIREMNEIKELGFGPYVARIYLDIQVIDYGQILRDRKIAEYLKTLVDVKMFDNEQKQFKTMMFDEFNYRDSNRKRKLGTKAFNQFLQEANIQYELISKRETSRKSEHFTKTYWLIKELQKMTQTLYIEKASKVVAPKTEQVPVAEETNGFPKADKPKHIKHMSAILFSSNYKGMELTDGMKSALAEIIKVDASMGELFNICIKHGLSSAEEHFIFVIYDEAKPPKQAPLEINVIDHEIEATKKYFYYVAPDEEDEFMTDYI